MKKVFFVFLLVSFLLFCSTPSFAQAEGVSLSFSNNLSDLNDGNETNRVRITESVDITSEKPIDSLYLIYYDTPVDFVISCDGVEKSVSASFLRKFVSIKELFGTEKEKFSISFSKEVELTEICGFAGEVPSWVQRWEEPLERADLCLFSSHADDEQLFFAGVLPYYAGEKGYAVQVIYFADHNKKPLRRHELLSGLWAVGVKNYPVISSFPDRYSTSQAEAEKHLQESGFIREDVLSFQVEMIRRFQPLVVVGHDPSGEYGHGQHMLNSATLQEAVLSAGNEKNFPDTAEKYGVWEVPKTYLHLLDENEIVMDWDTPLESFGGKSAFQVSQIGFSYHKSQHQYWFYTWLFGENGKIEKASQIKTYSPCKYGLFRSLVGEDVNKNDFFENLLTYETQEKNAEEERLRLEAEEKARLEEENRKAEELEKKLREEREMAEKENKKKRILAISLLSTFLFVIFLVAFIVIKKMKK